MEPDVLHCGNGPGPNIFDAVTVMAQWVENGTVPDNVVASHKNVNGVIDRTMPLCDYPETAHYDGTGSINDAASWTCS
jgi:feruloyl esterase